MRINAAQRLLSIFKIISGGQSGADTAALRFAIRHGIKHGGWFPRGRKREDGTIPPQFKLVETPSAAYAQRTKWNVRDSDGTVIFTIADRLSGGCRKTAQFARQLGKPCLHLAARRADEDHAGVLRSFIRQHRTKVLNVAGSRESAEPRIAAFVAKVLLATVSGSVPSRRSAAKARSGRGGSAPAGR